jgi:hypothetical protein
VFLQSLVRFLDSTAELEQFARLKHYARASLLHYARWMADHERFYLDEPEQLEFPTETWAAQELRKGTVLLMAARQAEPLEAEHFRSRGRQILDRAWQSLLSFPSRRYTRPVALVLQQGYLETYLNAEETQVQLNIASNIVKSVNCGPTEFVPQKKQLRHAIRSPRSIYRLLLSACQPVGWLNVWRQTWFAERLRQVHARSWTL